MKVPDRVLVVGGVAPGMSAASRIRRRRLVYAPPFAPVWDPVLVAANQLVKKVGGS